MKMTNYTHLYKNYLTVEITKPLFSYKEVDTVRVAKTIVDRAIHNFVALVVITPHGEKVFRPKEVRKDGLKVQEVFLRPDEPMDLFQLEVPYSEKSDPDRWKY